jgi:hypothetical protein
MANLLWMDGRPDLKEAHARARLAWADYWAERVLLISMDSSGDIFIDGAGKAMIDHANVQRARLQADSIKWLVGKYAPRTYGERPVVEEESRKIEISWKKIENVIVDPRDGSLAQELPRQITYERPRLPADLTEQDWSLLTDVLELIKRTVPTNDVRPPKEIFDVLRVALLAHFRDETETSSA